VVKHLAAMQNLGSMDVLCCDKTGTLTRGEMELVKVTDPFGANAQRPFALAYLNSSFETGIKSPRDAAILRHGQLDTTTYRKVDEVPFDFERRRLSVAVDGPGDRLLVTKGAPESVLRCCKHFDVNGETAPLDATVREKIADVISGLSKEGYRLLAPGQESFRASDESGRLWGTSPRRRASSSGSPQVRRTACSSP
jgi:Mg2+-importing ATPase